MPARKSYKPRARKPSVRRAKKIVAVSKKRATKKMMDTFYLRPKFNFVSVPTQGGTVSNYIYNFFPLLSSTLAVGVTQNAEFNLYRLMYDQVRINTVKITVTPKSNVFDQGNAQNDSAYTLTGDGMIHHVVDRDGTAPTNIGQLQRYGSYRKTSVMKKIVRSYSIKYPTGVWLDCQNIYEDETLLKRLGATGGITIYGENLVEDRSELFNEPWADIVIEYGVVFRGKTVGQLSLNDDGSVSVKHAEQTVNLTPSQIGSISGSFVETLLRQDASGNFIDEPRA